MQHRHHGSLHRSSSCDALYNIVCLVVLEGFATEAQDWQIGIIDGLSDGRAWHIRKIEGLGGRGVLSVAARGLHGVGGNLCVAGTGWGVAGGHLKLAEFLSHLERAL